MKSISFLGPIRDAANELRSFHEMESKLMPPSDLNRCTMLNSYDFICRLIF